MSSKSFRRPNRRSRSSRSRTRDSRERKPKMPTRDEVVEALKKVKFPGLSRDIVAFGFVHDVYVEGSTVGFTIRFQTENPAVGAQIAREAETAARGIAGVKDVKV